MFFNVQKAWEKAWGRWGTNGRKDAGDFQLYTFKIIWVVMRMNALLVLNCWPGNQASGHHLLSDTLQA